MKFIIVIKQILKEMGMIFRFFVLLIADIVAIQFVRLFKKCKKIIIQLHSDILCVFSGHKRQVHYYLLNRHPDCGRCGRLVK
jgi:hypothetical protein